MHWIPRWLGESHAKLFLQFQGTPFTFEEANEALKVSQAKLRLILSKLKQAELLFIFEVRGRKRYYRLLDLSTWEVMKAFGAKNLGKIRQGRYCILLAKFLRTLIGKHGEKLRTVCLFGSVARGRARAGSDIDLLIISEAFEGKKFGEVIEELMNVEQEREVEREKQFLYERGIYAHLSYYPLSPSKAEKFKWIYLDLTEDAILLIDRDGAFDRILNKLRIKLAELGAERIFLDEGKWYWKLTPAIRPGEEIKIEL